MDEGRPQTSDKGSPTAADEGWTATVDLARATRIDGRVYLARGEDPLTAILAAAAAVAIGDDLVVDAPFDPVPLRRLLGNRGFHAEAQELEAGHWRAFFRRFRPDPTPEAAPPDARCWWEDDAIHLDVRGLPPPEPMLVILKLVERLTEGTKVVVHHDREPIYLLPELAERGWRHAIERKPDGEVLIRLARGQP